MLNGEALYSDTWQRMAHLPTPKPTSVFYRKPRPSHFLSFFCLFIFYLFFIFFTHKTFHLHLQTRLNNGLKPCLKLPLSSTPRPRYAHWKWSSTDFTSLHPPTLSPMPRPPQNSLVSKRGREWGLLFWLDVVLFLFVRVGVATLRVDDGRVCVRCIIGSFGFVCEVGT